jgi:hypothetical protein
MATNSKETLSMASYRAKENIGTEMAIFIVENGKIELISFTPGQER